MSANPSLFSVDGALVKYFIQLEIFNLTYIHAQHFQCKFKEGTV